MLKYPHFKSAVFGTEYIMDHLEHRCPSMTAMLFSIRIAESGMKSDPDD